MSLNPYEPPREPAEPPRVAVAAPWSYEQQLFLLKFLCVPATALVNLVALFVGIRQFADVGAAAVVGGGMLAFGLAFYTWRSRYALLWCALQFATSLLIIALGDNG